MEQNAAHLSWVEQLLAWFEPKKKQVLIGFAVVLVVGFAAGYYLWSQGEKERVAGEAFSKVAAAPLFSPGAAESADAYLKVASGQPGTLAGSRALLQAATVFFTQGKFADAQSQFERLAREYPEGALFPQARLGAAACLDAQGKAPEAAALYKEVSEKFATTSVAPQARFALARIYEAQGKLSEAWNLFEGINRSEPNSSIGSEAGIRAEELKPRLPAAAPAPAAPAVSFAIPTNTPSVKTN